MHEVILKNFCNILLSRVTDGLCVGMSGGYFRVYPRHAPALGSPLHSLFSLRSRSAFDSSDGLRVAVGFVEVPVFALGLHLLLVLHSALGV